MPTTQSNFPDEWERAIKGLIGTAVLIDPKRMSGEPVFMHTRVPVRSLFDHIRAGVSLDTFLDEFEGVRREDALAVIDAMQQHLMYSLRAA